MVSAYCPLRMMGAMELVTQFAVGARLVVDSKVNSVKFVVQVKITLVPDRTMPICGDNERLNTVPSLSFPPNAAVP